jgi:hypothetical protein
MKKGLITTALVIGTVVAANATPVLTQDSLDYKYGNTVGSVGGTPSGSPYLSVNLTGFTLGPSGRNVKGLYDWTVNYSGLVGPTGTLTVTGSFTLGSGTLTGVTRYAGSVEVFDYGTASPVKNVSLASSTGTITGDTISFTDTVSFANTTGSGHFELVEDLIVPPGTIITGKTSALLTTPEPAPIAAVAFGVIGLIARRRKSS